MEFTLWLWLTVRHGFSMALIEIDGLPNLKMVDLSSSQTVTIWLFNIAMENHHF